MSVQDIRAIDIHVHYGTDLAGESEIPAKFMRGDVNEILRRANLANIELSIVSPLEGLFPRLGADPVAGNEHARDDLADNEHLRQWVILDPLKKETYAQVEELLPLPQCVGIKIHPEEHGYHVRSHGKDIFEFAAKHNAIVLTHSGESNSMPEDFLPFINAHPEVTLILAHLGISTDDDCSRHVRAVEGSQHGNVFVDTSSRANLFPGLLEWAVERIGAEKILFGTDSLLYFEPMQRIRIDRAEITDVEKKRILRDNAIDLFGFDLEQ